MTAKEKKLPWFPDYQTVSAYLIEIFVLSCLLIIDMVSKWQAQMHDAAIMNYGGVFGILPSGYWGMGLALLWLILFFQWLKSKFGLSRWGMGLIIVGGLGNIIDRVIFGFVRDFIYYPFFGFYGNAADIFLIVGVALILFDRITHDFKSNDSV